VFASDVYSIGITMYQMMTGDLPYQTPAPADLDKLMRGELVVAPRVRNPRIPKVISDIILRALAPDLSVRYSRAADLLDDLLAAREPTARRAGRGAAAASGSDTVAEIQSRLRAREAPAPRFCWHCRKPLHARSDRCPFCNETQASPR
jgi:serine/threonine-protein kinase